jgi:aryl-alcohol dehydrogenase-like predicted oxidoreductase
MNFWPRTSEEDAHAIMDLAHEAGINFFDTDNRYGREPGETETIIGNWFASGGGRRERTVIGTKVYGAMGSWPNEGKLSALNIRRALDASLGRLQTDYVDLYQFDHIDRSSPWEESWQAIEVAVQAGKILYAGSSNFAGWHIANAQELEVVPAAEHYGLGIIPWSPLQGGLLGGVIKKENTGVRRLEGRAAQSLAKHRDEIQAYEDLAEEVETEPGHVEPRLAAHPARGHRTDHRSANPRPVGQCSACREAEPVAGASAPP